MAHSMAEADLRDVLPTISIPTLLLYGELDQRAPLTVATDLDASIPTSRLVVLPGVGHVCNAEAPDEFNAQVRRFSDPSSSRVVAGAGPPRPELAILLADSADRTVVQLCGSPQVEGLQDPPPVARGYLLLKRLGGQNGDPHPRGGRPERGLRSRDPSLSFPPALVPASAPGPPASLLATPLPAARRRCPARGSPGECAFEKVLGASRNTWFWRVLAKGAPFMMRRSR